MNSEKLGKTSMKEIKTIKEYIVDDRPAQARMRSSKRRSFGKNIDQNDSVDIVNERDNNLSST